MSADASAAALADWVGRTESAEDRVGAAPLAMLSALLDRDDPPAADGDAIPPLAHWLYFLPTHRQSRIGADGHAHRGEFLPPVTLPRRMWAGSRVEFHRPLAVGEPVRRLSRIAAVAGKQGRSGPLVFVTVRHEVSGPAGLALVDEHEIVYRGADGPAAAPVAAPAGEAWSREIRPDPVLLFRYSAATFNGHRIHYDRPYATGVEGYTGLVVHGPLIATLLVDLLRRQVPDARVTRFDFRAVRPTIDTQPFFVCGDPQPDGRTVKLWGRDHEGWLTMDATVEIERVGAEASR